MQSVCWLHFSLPPGVLRFVGLFAVEGVTGTPVPRKQNSAETQRGELL